MFEKTFQPRFIPNSRIRRRGRRRVRRLLIPEFQSIERKIGARYARAWTRAICVGCVGVPRAQIDDGRKKGGAAPRPLARARLDVGVATPSWMKRHSQSHRDIHPRIVITPGGYQLMGGLVQKGTVSSPRSVESLTTRDQKSKGATVVQSDIFFIFKKLNRLSWNYRRNEIQI